VYSPNTFIRGSLLSNLPPEVQEFLDVLCRQRHDLFEYLVAVLSDRTAVKKHDKRTQLQYAYDKWLTSRTRRSPDGKVPNLKKIPFFEVPPDVQPLPQDAEILALLDDAFLHWTTPKLANTTKTRKVRREVDELYTDADGTPASRAVTLTVTVPDRDRYSPICALVA
jgi:hypothetical protein